jgi:hypothetical protein
MKTRNTQRYLHSSGYRPEWAREGILFKNALGRTTAPEKSPVHALIASLLLPAGANFYRAIRLCDADTLLNGDPYLQIWSPMDRARAARRRGDPSARILVPNFLAAVEPRAARRFLTWTDPQLLAEISRHTESYLPPNLDWTQFTRRLEACLHVSGFSPALVAYVNFIDDYAAPASW